MYSGNFIFSNPLASDLKSVQHTDGVILPRFVDNAPIGGLKQLELSGRKPDHT